MTRERRVREVIVARRERVWDATCLGKTTRQIAAVEGVAHMQIVRDLAAIHAAMGEDEDAPARKQRAANVARARYGMMIAKAMEEWERSKQERLRKRTKSRSKGGKSQPATEAEHTIEIGLGDPAYLNVAVKAQQRLDAIEGIDAPKEHNLTGGVKVQLMLTEEIIDANDQPNNPPSPNSSSLPPQ